MEENLEALKIKIAANALANSTEECGDILCLSIVRRMD